MRSNYDIRGMVLLIDSIYKKKFSYVFTFVYISFYVLILFTFLYILIKLFHMKNTLVIHITHAIIFHPTSWMKSCDNL
jgi:hypothetical protein